MDFTDTTYINLPDVTEQAWVDFIDIMKVVPDTTAIAAIKQMYKMADQKKVVLFYYTDLAEKYLYDPNSPMRNEELYIPVLDAMLESKVLNDTEKILPQGRRNWQNRIASEGRQRFHLYIAVRERRYALRSESKIYAAVYQQSGMPCL